jgi:hypothetical protein
MSRTNALEARTAALSRTATPPAKPKTAPRARPVSMTVDLAPELYRIVKDFPAQMGIPQATGKIRIPSAELFRALVQELADDEALRERVANRIADNLR